MNLLPFDYAARNAGRNPLKTVLTTVGAAAVVFLVILMGAFVQTLGKTLQGSGEADNAIVMGLGSEDYLEQSEIGFSVTTEMAASVEGIAVQAGSGKPMVSPEIHHSTAVQLTTDEAPDPAQANSVMVRGVTDMAYAVHRQVFITAGRPPQAGEILAGKLAATKMGLPAEALEIGKSLYFEGKDWTVSGTFEAPGTVFDAELWAPLNDLMITTKRDSLTCIIARTDSRDGFSNIDLFTQMRLDLELAMVPEAEYYQSLASFYKPMQMLGWIMAALITASGLFGGLNVMIASISSRARELACLETLGFSRRAIVLALLQEAMLQVGTGALLAAGLALLILRGRAIKVTMGALALDVNGSVLAYGFTAALVMAVLGTLIPSFSLVRKPLIETLR